jgi:hypothetical protein
MNNVGSSRVSSIRTSLRSAISLSWEPCSGIWTGLLCWFSSVELSFSFSATEDRCAWGESIASLCLCCCGCCGVVVQERRRTEQNANVNFLQKRKIYTFGRRTSADLPRYRCRSRTSLSAAARTLKYRSTRKVSSPGILDWHPNCEGERDLPVHSDIQVETDPIPVKFYEISAGDTVAWCFDQERSTQGACTGVFGEMSHPEGSCEMWLCSRVMSTVASYDSDDPHPRSPSSRDLSYLHTQNSFQAIIQCPLNLYSPWEHLSNSHLLMELSSLLI